MASIVAYHGVTAGDAVHDGITQAIHAVLNRQGAGL